MTYACIFFHRLCLEVLYLNKSSLALKTVVHITNLIQRPGKTQFLSWAPTSIGWSHKSFMLRQYLSPTDLQTHHQAVIQLPQCGVTLISHAKKLKLGQPLLPTTILMPVIVLLCVVGLPKWSPEIPSKWIFMIQWLGWLDYPGFPLAAAVSLVPAQPLIGSRLTQLMELICQRSNLTTMNDSFSAGIAPCITSPRGQMDDRGMPEKGESMW